MWNEGRFRRLIDCYLLINEYIFDYFDYEFFGIDVEYQVLF